MSLTLSRCGEEAFTCADGMCIEFRHRCDLVKHCRDFSDELGCDTVRDQETVSGFLEHFDPAMLRRTFLSKCFCVSPCTTL